MVEELPTLKVKIKLLTILYRFILCYLSIYLKHSNRTNINCMFKLKHILMKI